MFHVLSYLQGRDVSSKSPRIPESEPGKAKTVDQDCLELSRTMKTGDDTDKGPDLDLPAEKSTPIPKTNDERYKNGKDLKSDLKTQREKEGSNKISLQSEPTKAGGMADEDKIEREDAGKVDISDTNGGRNNEDSLKTNLKKYGLSSTNWLDVFKTVVGVTEPTQLRYMDREDLEKLQSSAQHNWERRALKDLHRECAKQREEEEEEEEEGESLEKLFTENGIEGSYWAPIFKREFEVTQPSELKLLDATDLGCLQKHLEELERQEKPKELEEGKKREEATKKPQEDAEKPEKQDNTKESEKAKEPEKAKKPEKPEESEKAEKLEKAKEPEKAQKPGKRTRELRAIKRLLNVKDEKDFEDSLKVLLSEAGLDREYWFSEFENKLGVTKPGQMKLIQKTDLKKVKPRFRWELAALEKIIGDGEAEEKKKEEFEEKQKKAKKILDELKEMNDKQQDRVSKSVVQQEERLRKALELPDGWKRKHEDVSLDSVISKFEARFSELKTLKPRTDWSPAEVVARASGGLAMRGILFGKEGYESKTFVLSAPKVTVFLNPRLPVMDKVHESSSKKQSDSFEKTLDTMGVSVAASVSGSYGLFWGSVSTAQKRNTETEKSSESHKNCQFLSQMKYVVIPTAACELSRHALRFSEGALEDLKRVEKCLLRSENIEERYEICEQFLNIYGSHVNVGLLHFGGLNKFIATYSSEGGSETSTARKMVSNALSTTVNASVIGGTGSLGTCVDTSVDWSSGSLQATHESAESSNVNVNQSWTGGPPEVSDLPLWRTGLLASNSTWALIDRGHLSLGDSFGIWDLIHNHKDEVDVFKNPEFLASALKNAWQKLSGMTGNEVFEIDALDSMLEQWLSDPGFAEKCPSHMRRILGTIVRVSDNQDAIKHWTMKLSRGGTFNRLFWKLVNMKHKSDKNLCKTKHCVRKMLELVGDVNFDSKGTVAQWADEAEMPNTESVSFDGQFKEKVKQVVKTVYQFEKPNSIDTDIKQVFEAEWKKEEGEREKNPKKKKKEKDELRTALSPYSWARTEMTGEELEQQLRKAATLKGSTTVENFRGKDLLSKNGTADLYKAVQCTISILREMETFLQSCSSNEVTFKDTFTKLESLLTKKANDADFKQEFKVMLAVHVGQLAQKAMTKGCDFSTRLNEYKELGLNLATHVAKRSTEEVIAAKLFCDEIKLFLKPRVMEFVSKEIVDEVLAQFLFSKDLLILTIQKDLLEHENFADFTSYIRDPYTYALNWITKTTEKRLFSRRLDPRTTKFAKKAIEKLSKMIGHICHWATQTTAECLKLSKSQRKTSKWIQIFCEKTGEEFSITSDCLKYFNTRNVQDWSRIGGLILKYIAPMESMLKKAFQEYDENTVEWISQSPFEHITDKLWGCRAQCPYCAEPCSFSKPNHVDESGQLHQCPHRPEAVTGFTDPGWFTDSLHSGTCFSVGKEYKEIFTEWEFESGTLNKPSNYWKWFMATYNKELHEHYGADEAKLPEDWTKVKKDDVLKELTAKLGKNSDEQDHVAGAYKQDHVDGADKQDYVDGADKQDYVDGADKQDYVDGAYKQDHVDGAYKQDYVDGADKQDYVDGADKQDYVDGADKQELGEEADLLKTIPDSK